MLPSASKERRVEPKRATARLLKSLLFKGVLVTSIPSLSPLYCDIIIMGDFKIVNIYIFQEGGGLELVEFSSTSVCVCDVAWMCMVEKENDSHNESSLGARG